MTSIYLESDNKHQIKTLIKNKNKNKNKNKFECYLENYNKKNV